MTFCPNLISATCATFSASKKQRISTCSEFNVPEWQTRATTVLSVLSHLWQLWSARSLPPSPQPSVSVERSAALSSRSPCRHNHVSLKAQHNHRGVFTDKDLSLELCVCMCVCMERAWLTYSWFTYQHRGIQKRYRQWIGLMNWKPP